MTRNEFIASVAARFAASGDFESIKRTVFGAKRLADDLEAANVAPWQSAPALPDAARRVVEAACGWAAWIGDVPDVALSSQQRPLYVAVRAYKESAK